MGATVISDHFKDIQAYVEYSYNNTNNEVKITGEIFDGFPLILD